MTHWVALLVRPLNHCITAGMTDVEFIVPGSPASVARAIESCAEEQRMVSALVVPWESRQDVISMSVTSARVDGWAVEHTNLGTIHLTDAGSGRTRIAIHGEALRGPDEPRLTRLFEEFGRMLERRLQAAR